MAPQRFLFIPAQIHLRKLIPNHPFEESRHGHFESGAGADPASQWYIPVDGELEGEGGAGGEEGHVFVHYPRHVVGPGVGVGRGVSLSFVGRL